MTEAAKQPSTHAYLVAGGGGGMRSTIILRMIANSLTSRGIPYTPIEGIQGTGDSQRVHNPSLQEKDMEAFIGDHEKDTALLFISHCIGTVAALNTLEKVVGSRRASLVSVAPPLPSPHETIMTPQSQKKRSQGGTLMRVVDLPEGAVDYSEMTESVAHISPQYFTDMEAASDLSVRLKKRVEAGHAAVFAPEHDWNIQSPLTIRDWHDEWSATRSAADVKILQGRAPIVYDAAHGLYLSPRIGREITTEEDVAFQMNNVSSLIDTGLDLLDRPGSI